jgi:accessory colonization factor AcfC
VKRHLQLVVFLTLPVPGTCWTRFNMMAEEIALVYHVPVLAVPKGNPAHIKTLSDLARPGSSIWCARLDGLV